jgi:hypothetical protein
MWMTLRMRKLIEGSSLTRQIFLEPLEHFCPAPDVLAERENVREQRRTKMDKLASRELAFLSKVKSKLITDPMSAAPDPLSVITKVRQVGGAQIGQMGSKACGRYKQASRRD